MSRGLALLVLGAWMGLLVASWAVAQASFGKADAAAANPHAQASGEGARPLLRYLAAEINRAMFGSRTVAELALGLGLVALLFRGPGRGLAIAALVVVVLQGALLAPAIASLGRSLDFLPRPLPGDVAKRFGMLHGAYVLLDLGKAALLAWASAALLRSPLP
jgi:hypothetical protein